MKFWKMNGAGNDFIVINNIEENIPVDKLPALAAKLCHRHMSIGADGLMAVAKAQNDGDYRMLFYNSDGTAGEMCGNGARCICRYGYENGLAGDVQRVETMSGTVIGRRIDDRYYKIRLNDPSVIELDKTLEVDGKEYSCAYVELGTPGLPHAAVEIKGLADMSFDDLRRLGKALRWHKAFPKGANVNFYDFADEEALIEKTYERGVEDFTYACGTGTGSVVTALTLMGRLKGKNTKVSVPGGTLYVTVEHDGSEVKNLFLTGPTNIVAKGEICDEDLSL